MDPLSIAVSIVGICTAAVQVNALLKRFVDSSKNAPASARHVLNEITGIYACLNALDAFLSGRQESPRSRTSLVMIEQVVVVFTDCVSIFSELEQTIDSLKADGPMSVIDRAKWALKEKVILKLLMRLQTSKQSLTLMLNTLTCASVDSAEASTRELTTLVHHLLRSNMNMSRRLRNIERMHPAMHLSACPSRDMSMHGVDLSPFSGCKEGPETDFNRELETSPVYKRVASKNRRVSQSSSNAASGLTFLSRLSLSDVSNVTAMALPISSTELWNHHRYATRAGPGAKPEGLTLDAWYYPPAKKSAFIRTAYFNGHYTNQYAQTKFTGHLIYRRFSVTGPDRSPRFKEGLSILSSRDQGQPCSDKNEAQAELEDTSPCAVKLRRSHQRDIGCDKRLGEQRPDLVYATCSLGDSSSSWGQGLLRMLDSIG